MTNEKLVRILIFSGMIVLTFGLVLSLIALEQPSATPLLVLCSLSGFGAGSVIILIGIEGVLRLPRKSEVNVPRRRFKLFVSSFARSGIVIVLVGLAIAFFHGDELAQALAVTAAQAFIVTLAIDFGLSLFVEKSITTAATR